MSYPQLLQQVQCPADRGDKPYTGRILHVGSTIHYNVQGTAYIWLLIEKYGTEHTRTKHTWPSNRLGFTVRESL